jgi:hypothetical protein
MTTRSILLGCLGLGTLLAGGCFEKAPMIDPDDSGTDETVAGTTAPSTETTTAPPTTTVDPTTSEPTTTNPLDTTADGTTTEVSATDSTSTSDSSTTGDPCVAACDGLACGPAGACDCGMCGPMATCATDKTYCGLPIGFSNDFGDSSNPVGGQLQLGFGFEVFAPTNVRRLGLIAGGAGANVRLALYDDDGAGPYTRLVQTGAVVLYANGVNEFDVGATPIAPGTYWVMLHTEGNTPLRRTLNGDNMYPGRALRSPVPFASGFPVTMTDETMASDYRYNLYMVVEE